MLDYAESAKQPDELSGVKWSSSFIHSVLLTIWPSCHVGADSSEVMTLVWSFQGFHLVKVLNDAEW